MKVCPLLQDERSVNSSVEGCTERVDGSKCWSIFHVVCTSPWLEVGSQNRSLHLFKDREKDLAMTGTDETRPVPVSGGESRVCKLLFAWGKIEKGISQKMGMDYR